MNSLARGTVFPMAQLKFASLRNLHTSRIAQGEINLLGKTINYEELGNGDQVLLCLPGALGTIKSDFGPQLKSLPSKHLQLVAWDPPGYGKSRPPNRDFNFDSLRTDATMAAVMMKNLGYKKYSLLGWSDGGITAMLLAAGFTQHVEKMIIFGANAYITKEETEICKDLRDIDNWSPKMRAPLEAIYGRDYFKNAWESWVDTYIGIYHERDGDLCKDDLANIVCPTLIVHGIQDPVVPIEHPYYLHKNIQGSELILMEKGKHNLHLRYSEEFNAIVLKFLNK
ncbi:valacyclovir hydrolase-like [Penaeus monodon]|uniref:valacyclovir hydrolase-like n=1 Tax=Penaeus monodon TaxID=6687 RepID=UPI0018A76B0E|nr:valacyclovir hydrolase-like [Penaeus monodon]